MMAELQSHIRKVWKRNELLSRTEPSRIGSEKTVMIARKQ